MRKICVINIINNVILEKIIQNEKNKLSIIKIDVLFLMINKMIEKSSNIQNLFSNINEDINLDDIPFS